MKQDISIKDINFSTNQPQFFEDFDLLDGLRRARKATETEAKA